MNGKRTLILLGGAWHDFVGFAEIIPALLAEEGLASEPTYDPDDLLRLGLAEERRDLVVLYTCYDESGETGEGPGARRPTNEQVRALADWVQGGGALLGIHGATVAGESAPAFGALLGASFVSHPARHDFTVYPVAVPHPITAGIEPFTVRDELYLHEFEASPDVHMVALYGGAAHPLVWSRREGRGRVAYLALGHDREVWDHPAFRRILRQAARWLIGPN